MIVNPVISHVIAHVEVIRPGENVYVSFRTGMPKAKELADALRERFPDKDLEVYENINGITIKERNHDK